MICSWIIHLHTYDKQRSSICVPRIYSTTCTRSASSAAALKQRLTSQPTLPQQIQALPEVQVDDLPISSMGDHKVAIGWDPRTWSRLYVSVSSSSVLLGLSRILSHYIWLRDHCRCPKCFHAATKQRLVNTFEVCP